MTDRFKRQRFLAGATALGISISVPRTRAEAAQFDYKAGDDVSVDHPLSVRMTEMFAAIKKETGGKLNVQMFANNQLGNDTAMMSQVRSGAMQFMAVQGVILQSIVPNLGMDGLGFVYKDAATAEAAFDGPMGAYLRKLITARGITAFPRVWNLGMREITSSTKPIRNASDLSGFKIRTPPAPLTVDLFRTLGASPTPINFAEVYPALQTKVVEGQETPFSVIETTKLFEVQKYLSVTNHSPTIFWLIANTEAWNALSNDLKASFERNAAKYAVLQRHDVAVQSAALSDKLQRQGLTFVKPDTESMIKVLGPYYEKWKKEFGTEAWDLLEKAVGRKLG